MEGDKPGIFDQFARAARVAAQARIEAIKRQIRTEGECPEGNNLPDGDRLMDTQDIYGGGDWFVVGAEHIWYVLNNGADGDNWAYNNVRTGGAGAIGWRISRRRQNWPTNSAGWPSRSNNQEASGIDRSYISGTAREGGTEMRPISMTEVLGKRRYTTEGATLLAGDDYWDGHNHERRGRNTFLYRTAKGGYFAVHQTCWQGEQDRLQPLTQDEAIQMFEELSEKRVSFEDAFPGVAVEQA